MAPGSVVSARSTASPRYTCVPGVQAYAALGSSTSRSSATMTTAADRSTGRPRARSHAEAAALAANRLAKLALYEPIDALARLAHRFPDFALDPLGRDLIDELTPVLARPPRAREAGGGRTAPRPLGASQHGRDGPRPRGSATQEQSGRGTDRRADERRGEQVVLGVTPNLAVAGGLADAWLPLRAGRDRCTHRRSPPASDPARRASRRPRPRCEARRLRCVHHAPSTPSR